MISCCARVQEAMDQPADAKQTSKVVHFEVAGAGADDGRRRTWAHETHIRLALAAGGSLEVELRTRGLRLHWSRLRVRGPNREGMTADRVGLSVFACLSAAAGGRRTRFYVDSIL